MPKTYTSEPQTQTRPRYYVRIPIELGPKFAAADFDTCAIAISIIHRGQDRPIEHDGDWKAAVCRQLFVSPRKRSGFCRTLQTMADRGQLVVTDTEVWANIPRPAPSGSDEKRQEASRSVEKPTSDPPQVHEIIQPQNAIRSDQIREDQIREGERAREEVPFGSPMDRPKRPDPSPRALVLEAWNSRIGKDCAAEPYGFSEALRAFEAQAASEGVTDILPIAKRAIESWVSSRKKPVYAFRFFLQDLSEHLGKPRPIAKVVPIVQGDPKHRDWLSLPYGKLCTCSNPECVKARNDPGQMIVSPSQLKTLAMEAAE